MLLSRFWYVLLGLVLGGFLFVLYLAQSMYNRQGSRGMAEGLSADSQVVSWYLKNDARERSAHLIKFALEGSIVKGLAESSASEAKVPEKAKDSVAKGLQKVVAKIPKDQGFDAVFAVDQSGRVVAHVGYDQAAGMEDFELGGYPVVADALHGFVRDDTLVLDRVYRVVARPVESDLGQMPAGAIIGARIIDDRFARELSTRTGAAVAFYANGARVASGAPEGFDRSQLDMIITDLKQIENDPDYKQKGRSALRVVNKVLGVVYGRLPGEAWDLGAGYVVGRNVLAIESPFAFFGAADDKDKSGANIPVVAGVALAAMVLGILFTMLEHSRPLHVFRDEAKRLAKGETENLAPSKFRGLYRTIASDVNDAIDKAVGKGGGTRRAADLEKVLGDLPAEPQMSAFSFPGDTAAPSPSAPRAAVPSAPMASRPRSESDEAPAEGKRLPAPPRRMGLPGQPPPPPSPAAAPTPSASGEEPTAEWQQVFDEFAATKEKCGEPLDGFTFEKFQNTLRKHRDAIVERHGVKRVKFSVYIKDGKAALKASPIKD